MNVSRRLFTVYSAPRRKRDPSAVGVCHGRRPESESMDGAEARILVSFSSHFFHRVETGWDALRRRDEGRLLLLQFGYINCFKKTADRGTYREFSEDFSSSAPRCLFECGRDGERRFFRLGTRLRRGVWPWTNERRLLRPVLESHPPSS